MPSGQHRSRAAAATAIASDDVGSVLVALNDDFIKEGISPALWSIGGTILITGIILLPIGASRVDPPPSYGRLELHLGPGRANLLCVRPAESPGGSGSSSETSALRDGTPHLGASHERVHAGVSEMQDVWFAVAQHKVGEMVALLRANGVAVTSTKCVLHVLVAITGFGAGPSEVARRVSEAAHHVGLPNALASPLVEDISAVCDAVRA